MQVAPSIIASVAPRAVQPESAGAAGLAELAGLGFAMGAAPEESAEATGLPGVVDGMAFAEVLAASLAGVQPQATAVSPAPPPVAEPAGDGRARISPSVSLPLAPLPQTELAGLSPDAADPAGADPASPSAPITGESSDIVPPAADAKRGSVKAAPADAAPPAPSASGADVDTQIAVARTSPQGAVPPAAASPPSPPSPAQAAPIQTQALVASQAQPTSAAARNLVRSETKAPGPRDVPAVDATSQGTQAKPTVEAAKGAFVVAPDQMEATDAETGGGAQTADAPEAATKLAETPAPATAAPSAPTSLPAGPARADHTTVPHLVSQMVQKAGAKVTRFDLELAPQGLGRVDVKVEISASGVLTAALSFDNPQAAAELRGRADELKTALQQAGFDVADNSLNFDFNGDKQQRHARSDEDASGVLAGRAFAAANDAADDILATVTEAAARYQRRGVAGGLDIRI